MKIANEDLLKRYRTAGKCEWCGKACSKREPHHLFAKGMGGGGWIDLSINLIALGSTPAFCCACHTMIEAGNIIRDDVLEYVARRERTTASAIEDVIYLIRRLDKNDSQETIWYEIECLEDPESRRLAKEQLEKAGIL